MLTLQEEDLVVPNGKTVVFVSYLPFSSVIPPMPCIITIYTATGPRHPVMAQLDKKTTGDWESQGETLVNNYPIGTIGTSFGEHLRFTFDCPAPGQYWEIHIENLPFVPFPSFLDSMIGSCEARAFAITYPGAIARILPVPTSQAEAVAGYVTKAEVASAATT